VLETPEAKAEYARETGALAVDMESATVAAFFREKGVPFLALRAISDAASEPLPVPSSVWFDPREQRPRPWALIRFLLRHPRRIGPFVRFVLTIGRARRTLTAALLDLLASQATGEIL
jgi:adenosylhomocysteine nucleosidase